MALRDYEEMDEADFYGQGFEKNGVISVWAGLTDARDGPADVDVLQDLCGVGYYYLDDQEATHRNGDLVPIDQLLSDLSYSSTYRDVVVRGALSRGIECARWLVVQFNFAYDPQRVKRPVAPDPVFLGVYPYSSEG